MNGSTIHTEMLRFVNAYLARGWALVPLHSIGPNGCTCTRGTERCMSAGKHPIRREWHAPLNLIRDASAWQPGWNVGIATGRPSGHWVLDLDPDHAGSDALGIVADLTSLDNREPHVRTGGGGEHWRFELPPDFEVTNRRGSLPAGLDVRGTGGQVVAPPSVSGKGSYVALTDAPPYVAPAWLLDMIRPAPTPTTREAPAGWSPLRAESADPSNDRGQRYARAAVAELLTELGNAQHNRNDMAFRAACRIIELANAGWLDRGQAWMDWEAATLTHPLGIVVPYAEVTSLWTSASRRIGDRAAELPPEWTDPLRVEIWPAPPVAPEAVPPFSPSSNGAASIPGFSEPGAPFAGPVLGAGSTRTDQSPPTPGGSPTGTDDRWELMVQAEVNRRLVRRAAEQRLAELESGDLAAVKARLRGELLDTSALLARPRLAPLVDGLLFRNTLVRIVGRPGHGKSFVTLDLAAHVAAGLPWAGRVTHAARGAYVVAEGDEGFGGRVAAWQAHHGRGVELVYLPRAVQIGGPEWLAWCEVMAEDGFGQIVIDTQARATVGRDEIDGRDMGEVTAALDRLRVSTRAMVALVHHTNASGGTTGRGHGGMLGALETELYVSMDGRVITVKGGKSKDTAKPEDIVFDLVDVPAPAIPGFSEPGPAAILGVVPVWRGTSAVAPDGTVRESARKVRARQLWTLVHQRYNPGMGGTLAEIRQAFADVTWAGPTSGPAGAGFRKAWARAWADLIQLGLIAKSFGAGRFKVVELVDQSIDGVLSPNRGKSGELISEGPTGFEIILTDVTESNA